MSKPIDPPGVIDPDPHYRRAFPRIIVKRTAYLHTAGAAGVGVQLCDLSRGGVSFTSDRTITIGDRFEMSLGTDPVTGPRMEARVCWVVFNEVTRLSRAGCSWTRILSESELAALT